MDVRQATPAEYPELWKLFHDTVHHVNRQDYAPQQLAAWAPDEVDPSRWAQRMERIRPIVVRVENQVVGFSDVQADGLIDMFYVHHRWQRKGVGRALLTEIHRLAAGRSLQELHSHVSITARPFFEAHGFRVVTPQEVTIGSVSLTNYLMKKTLTR